MSVKYVQNTDWDDMVERVESSDMDEEQKDRLLDWFMEEGEREGDQCQADLYGLSLREDQMREYVCTDPECQHVFRAYPTWVQEGKKEDCRFEDDPQMCPECGADAEEFGTAVTDGKIEDLIARRHDSAHTRIETAVVRASLHPQRSDERGEKTPYDGRDEEHPLYELRKARPARGQGEFRKFQWLVHPATGISVDMRSQHPDKLFCVPCEAKQALYYALVDGGDWVKWGLRTSHRIMDGHETFQETMIILISQDVLAQRDKDAVLDALLRDQDRLERARKIILGYLGLESWEILLEALKEEGIPDEVSGIHNLWDIHSFDSWSFGTIKNVDQLCFKYTMKPAGWAARFEPELLSKIEEVTGLEQQVFPGTTWGDARKIKRGKRLVQKKAFESAVQEALEELGNLEFETEEDLMVAVGAAMNTALAPLTKIVNRLSLTRR